MAKWMRNVGTQAVASARGTNLTARFLAEIFKTLGFTATEVGGWSSNYIVQEPGGANGFQVDSTKPREVYDPLGRFTQAMADNQYCLSLRGGLLNDDQNTSMWRITEYVDANHVKVDTLSWNPYGWVTDTQLAGNVIDFDANLLTVSDQIDLDAPAAMGRWRIRMIYQGSSNLAVDVAPMYNPLAITAAGTPDAITGTAPTMTVTIVGLIGKLNKHMVGTNITIAGAANANDDGTFPITAFDTTTGAVTYTNALGVGDANFTGTATIAGITTFTNTIEFGNYYNRRSRISVYADDDVVHIYYTNRQSNNGNTYPYNWLSVGRLLGAATEDSDPVFFFGDATISGTKYPWEVEIRMLDGAVGPADIMGYMTYWIRDWSITSDDSAFCRQFSRRLVNGSPGKMIMIEPWVVLADTAVVGACVRGRFPKFRLAYTGLDKLRPVDAAGTWVHFIWGFFYPMNGPEDNLPMLTEW